MSDRIERLIPGTVFMVGRTVWRTTRPVDHATAYAEKGSAKGRKLYEVTYATSTIGGPVEVFEVNPGAGKRIGAVLATGPMRITSGGAPEASTASAKRDSALPAGFFGFGED